MSDNSVEQSKLPQLFSREQSQLRDQFAQAALIGLLSNPVSFDVARARLDLVVEAWHIADLMLEGRKG